MDSFDNSAPTRKAIKVDNLSDANKLTATSLNVLEELKDVMVDRLTLNPSRLNESPRRVMTMKA
jgi:gamma-glutamyl phosphate reductase